jgi:osmotically-inducible protein OsmY
MNKTDIHLKQDIEQELLWDPKVNSAQIGVSVDKGAVSLLGSVDTYPQKWAAEEATKRVSGVRTVAQDLKVMVLADHKRDDTDIARALQHALDWDVLVPDAVTARVENGAVTLEGTVQWQYQIEAAEQAVCNLAGVAVLYNTIRLVPRSPIPESEVSPTTH